MDEPFFEMFDPLGVLPEDEEDDFDEPEELGGYGGLAYADCAQEDVAELFERLADRLSLMEIDLSELRLLEPPDETSDEHEDWEEELEDLTERVEELKERLGELI